MTDHMKKELTGRIRYSILERIFMPDKVVLEVEEKVTIGNYVDYGSHVDYESYTTLKWRDATAEDKEVVEIVDKIIWKMMEVNK